ncbi:hypothetical protein PCANC_28747, partial [Puccinia coronata f. sp. avenae]
MSAGVASIFRQFDQTDWDVKRNHHRCVCHVIALILGAGLKALKLSKSIVRPEKPGWEAPDAWANEDDDQCDTAGIGFTLKKKQSEWKLWAKKLGYEGRGVIGGYGICWNIAYDSRQRAYEGRRVIKQLLDNESDKFAGKSHKDHFFKSYELSTKEWEDVNSLNCILKDFLEMTKRMEGDGPKLGMVLYEYDRVLNSLRRKEITARDTVLDPMFQPMLTITKNKSFDKHTSHITDLINKKFKECKTALELLKPSSLEPKQTQSDPEIDAASTDEYSNGKEYDFFQETLKLNNVNTELDQYNKSNFPMDKKGCALGWWKLHAKDFPVLSVLARDYLACPASSASVERTFSAAEKI